jgi:hypothetical protein
MNSIQKLKNTKVFTKRHQGYWKSIENQKNFIKQLEHNFAIKNPSDWYNITIDKVRQHGGKGLLNLYAGSLIKGAEFSYRNLLAIALQHLYPSYNLTHTERANYGYLKDVNNQRALFDELGNKLGVKKLEDWYKVSRAEVLGIGQGEALFVLESYGGSLATGIWFNVHCKQRWGEVKNLKKKFFIILKKKKQR